MARINFVKRSTGELFAENDDANDGIVAIDVSRKAKEPFNRFSPWTFSADFRIYVPGMREQTAHSVEGIWQGLKVVNGKIDARCFADVPVDRGNDYQGHLYENGILGSREAREKIYIPAYNYYLDNYGPRDAIKSILEQQRRYSRIFIYDSEYGNENLNEEPLSHGSFLETYLNLRAHYKKLEPIGAAERRLFGVLDDQELSLLEKVLGVEDLIEDDSIKKAFLYRCVDHPQQYHDVKLAEILRKALE